LLLCFILLSSCVPNASSALPVLGETDLSAFHYLALGDSYTIGESVSAEERWPNRLAKLLEDDGIQTEVTIIARTGWTVDDLWHGIKSSPPEGTYDLVTLLIGVNDQYRGYPIDGYRQDFHFMLEKAIEYADGNPDHVIVLSIPDWGVTPFAVDRDAILIGKQIDDFNNINLAESKLAEVHYVDITPISREAVADTTLIARDGLHPSGKMYAMWAGKSFPIVKEILIKSK